ncbi:MAG: peroxiredoxin [Clostridia bacterium]|nr:peroxiredoxin [Clostridia bacterium]
MDYELMMNGNVKIGQKAPSFTAESTYGTVNLDDYKGKWLVFFSHPGDFTPVCTTEMISFAKANPYFEKLNTCLLGISIDSNPSHLAWMKNIYDMTGIVLPFPIIADRNGSIARKYGMISNDISTTETVRNVFIIDDKGIVRVILVYPLNVGRFIPEILRTVQALQMADCTEASTPANWLPGQPVIMRPPRTFPLLRERENYINQNNNGMSWYLSFQSPDTKCINQIETSCTSEASLNEAGTKKEQ